MSQHVFVEYKVFQQGKRFALCFTKKENKNPNLSDQLVVPLNYHKIVLAFLIRASAWYFQGKIKMLCINLSFYSASAKLSHFFLYKILLRDVILL